MSNTDKEIQGYLVFKKVRINYANSISSPITYGFPAITGFLGAIHALSRKLQKYDFGTEVSLGGVLIACHECEPLVYRPNNYSDYTFNQSRNPIKKDGKTASIIEEGKCHLTVTLAVEVWAEEDEDGDISLDDESIKALEQHCLTLIQQQRIAGGSVQGLSKYKGVQFLHLEEIAQIKRFATPAFILMDAQKDLDELTEQQQAKNPEANALDALLDVCALHHVPVENENDTVQWQVQSAKSGRGWLVPMPIGYQGISQRFEPGLMQNARNPEYPSQHVEAIYGLGKWVFPHRIENFKQAFWRYSHDAEQSLFLTTQTL